MTAVAVLNPAAQVALADCEQRIERGLRTFIDVGQALAEIRDSRLYKGTHGTFEEYCRDRWKMSDGRARQFMIAASTATNVAVEGLPAPTNEGQARALAAVPEPERAEVWREAVERTNGKPTAAAVRTVHEERTQTPGPSDAAEPPPVGPGTTIEPGCEHCGAAINEEQARAGYKRCAGCDPQGDHYAATFPHGSDGPCVICEPDANPEPAGTPTAQPAGSAESATPTPARTAPASAVDALKQAKRVAEQRDARALLSRVIEILAPVNGSPGFVDTWLSQLGALDDELTDLVKRAAAAHAVLGDLIERASR